MNDEFPCTHQPGEQAMSADINRRTILAATAALPATALPAIAAEPLRGIDLLADAVRA